MTVNSSSVLNDQRDTAIFALPTRSSGIPLSPTAPDDSVSFRQYSFGRNLYRATETAAPVSNKILVGTFPKRLSA